jgi:Pentapeptide repeats (8 copies)
MIIHEERKRPEPWGAYRNRISLPLLTPFYAFDWLFAWLAHYLSRWVLLEVLEYMGTFSILIAVIFYFAESGDRIKQKHYQAWQVINTAQGKGGSGGRIEALQELNADRVPLVGIDLSDAFLQGVQLENADLLRSNFGSADLRNSSFRSANLIHAGFATANLRGSNLQRANLSHANFADADLSDANLSGADLTGADLDKADLRGADLRNTVWKDVGSIRLANLFGAKNVPPGFADWASKNGAVLIKSDDQWNALQASAERKK